MRNFRLLVLLVVLSIAAYAARYAFIWASTPVNGTTSFDYFMSGVFAVFGVFTLAIFAVMLAYAIMEKPAHETTTVETPAETTTVQNAPVCSSPACIYAARQNARIADYNARQNARIADYNARQNAAIADYNARMQARIDAYNSRNN
jgi:hypothetical protein